MKRTILFLFIANLIYDKFYASLLTIYFMIALICSNVIIILLNIYYYFNISNINTNDGYKNILLSVNISNLLIKILLSICYYFSVKLLTKDFFYTNNDKVILIYTFSTLLSIAITKIIRRYYILYNGIDTKYNNDYTNLMFAVSSENVNLVKIFLNLGADVNKDGDNKTPLNLLVINENEEIMDLLLEKKVDINKANSYGTNPLMFSCMYKKYKMVNKLIENKADLNKKNIRGKLALMLAVENGSLDIVKKLIENKANINDTDNINRNSVFLAAYYNKPCIVKYLLTNGAIHDIPRKGGDTIYDIIKRYKYEEIYNFLEKDFKNKIKKELDILNLLPCEDIILNYYGL